MTEWQDIDKKLPKDWEKNTDKYYLCRFLEEDDGSDDMPIFYVKYGVFQYSEDEEERTFFNEELEFKSKLITKDWADNEDLIGEYTGFASGSLTMMTHWTCINELKENE